MLVRVMLVVLVCGALAAGQAAPYLKAWDDPQEGPEGRVSAGPPPFDAALLARLQTYLGVGGAGEEEGPAPRPSKRQTRYNQCYFNPISCFRRRK